MIGVGGENPISVHLLPLLLFLLLLGFGNGGGEKKKRKCGMEWNVELKHWRVGGPKARNNHIRGWGGV